MSPMDGAADINPTGSGDAFGSSYSTGKDWESEKFGEITARNQAIYARELQAVSKTMSADIQNVLEFGFGQGSFMAYCREQGWQANGTEASEPLVKAAGEAGFIVKLASEAGALPDAVAGPIIALMGWMTKAIHFPRSGMVLTSANVAACVIPFKSESHSIG